MQRDILPIVEGTTVNTKHGMVRTDHILFIAAGAFHVSKPSDLIPELQGRFPIRVELEALGREDFVRILTEPKSALVKQYTALLADRRRDAAFTDEAIERIADFATLVNERTENIGARRLHTVMEKLLDEVSFDAPDLPAEDPSRSTRPTSTDARRHRQQRRPVALHSVMRVGVQRRVASCSRAGALPPAARRGRRSPPLHLVHPRRRDVGAAPIARACGSCCRRANENGPRAVELDRVEIYRDDHPGELGRASRRADGEGTAGR